MRQKINKLAQLGAYMTIRSWRKLALCVHEILSSLLHERKTLRIIFHMHTYIVPRIDWRATSAW